MIKPISRLLLGTMAAFIITPLLGQHDVLNALLQCRDITDAKARLGCYDQLASEHSSLANSAQADLENAASESVTDHAMAGANSTETDSSAADAVMSLQQLRQEQQQLADEKRALEQEKLAIQQQRQALLSQQAAVDPAVQSAPAETVADNVMSEAEQLEAFGAEQIASKLREKNTAKAKARLDRIRARVVTVRGDRRRGYILVLDNGQVWSQRGTRYIDFLSEEKMEVEIERNAMNGYRLNQLATNRRIFVERIR